MRRHRTACSVCHASERQPRRRRRSLSSSRRLAADARLQRIALVGRPRVVGAAQAPCGALASRATQKRAWRRELAARGRWCICKRPASTIGDRGSLSGESQTSRLGPTGPAFALARVSSATPETWLLVSGSGSLERRESGRRDCPCFVRAAVCVCPGALPLSAISGPSQASIRTPPSGRRHERAKTEGRTSPDAWFLGKQERRARPSSRPSRVTRQRVLPRVSKRRVRRGPNVELVRRCLRSHVAQVSDTELPRLVQRISRLEDPRVFRNARKGKSRGRCSRH